jgi:hypothetical protein
MSEPSEQSIVFKVGAGERLSANGSHGNGPAVNRMRQILRTKAWAQTRDLINRGMLEPYDCLCDVICWVRLPRRPSSGQFDADNLQPTFKPLMDGIVAARLFKDDSYQYINERRFRYDPRPTGRTGIWEFELHFVPLGYTWGEYESEMLKLPAGRPIPTGWSSGLVAFGNEA